VKKSSPSLGRRAGLAPALAAVAGYVDAVGYLSLNVFTAHMSGNSARLGVYFAHHGFHDALVVAVAVGVFVASIAVGALVMEVGTRAGWPAVDSILLIIEAVLLGVFTVIGGFAQVHGAVPARPAARFYGLVACAVTAIGLQTASLQRISGQTVRTTYVSGMLTGLADEVVAVAVARRVRPGRASYLRDELGMRKETASGRRMLLIMSIWFAYVAGATGGALLHQVWQLDSLALPTAVLIVLAAAAWRMRTVAATSPDRPRSGAD
jgi:uncharacterized membrane protein YoaK (UPF0700 family)